MGVPKKILQSSLVRATSLNALGVLIKIAIGFATSKVIAVFIGPSGMALVGNLRNFLTALENMATLGFQSGIVKYVAETKNSATDLKKVLSTVFISLGITLILCCLALFAFSGFWSAWIFGGTQKWSGIFRVLALALPFYALSIALIAVLNGLGNYRKVIWANSIGNIIGLGISVVLIVQYKLFGALLAIVLSPSALFFVTIFYLRKEFPASHYIALASFDASLLRKLGAYSAMTLFSAICVPFIFIAIRQEAVAFSGLEAAGHWEAMNRISSYYMLFVTTLVSVYFLPKLVMAQKEIEIRNIFLGYLKTIIPAFIGGAFVLFLTRKIIVYVLLTDEFEPVSQLFAWQLIGDVFRSISVIFGCCLIAKKNTKAFFATEIFSLTVLYASSHFLLERHGIGGLVMAHALTYGVYALVLIGYFRKTLFKSEAS